MPTRAAARSPACTCFRLRRLARQVSQLYDRELAAAGMTITQYSILRRASARRLSMSELARTMGMERTTLTRNLGPLLAAGWVTCVRGDDARQRCIEVTPLGRSAVAEARCHWQHAQDHVEAILGSAALQRLHRELDRTSTRIADTKP